jgi:uncharacterized protein YdeI (YjbR/CyaY-like superfamily)
MLFSDLVFTTVMKPTFFATPTDFRRWLKENHASETELWVGFHKKDTGKPSITWPQSVDQALCYGWIDGIRKSLGAESYVIRFTPRRRGSIWSLINTRRATELIADGLMRAAGKRAFEARDAAKSGVYSFEQKTPARLPPAAKKRFMANEAAWEFFESQPPGYRNIAIRYVVSAKQEVTRDRRLGLLIKDSEAGRRIGPLRRPGED